MGILIVVGTVWAVVIPPEVKPRTVAVEAPRKFRRSCKSDGNTFHRYFRVLQAKTGLKVFEP